MRKNAKKKKKYPWHFKKKSLALAFFFPKQVQEPSTRSPESSRTTIPLSTGSPLPRPPSPSGIFSGVPGLGRGEGDGQGKKRRGRFGRGGSAASSSAGCDDDATPKVELREVSLV